MALTELVAIGAFFDDAVFIGDSVSRMLSYYANDYGVLANAKLLLSNHQNKTDLLTPYECRVYLWET